jgi:hypothetical protein
MCDIIKTINIKYGSILMRQHIQKLITVVSYMPEDDLKEGRNM